MTKTQTIHPTPPSLLLHLLLRLPSSDPTIIIIIIIIVVVINNFVQHPSSFFFSFFPFLPFLILQAFLGIVFQTVIFFFNLSKELSPLFRTLRLRTTTALAQTPLSFSLSLSGLQKPLNRTIKNKPVKKKGLIFPFPSSLNPLLHVRLSLTFAYTTRRAQPGFLRVGYSLRTLPPACGAKGLLFIAELRIGVLAILAGIVWVTRLAFANDRLEVVVPPQVAMKRYHQQILLRPPSSNRREPLLKPRPSFSEAAVLPVSASVKGNQDSGKITSIHVAEAVGSTTAECVAVCCCCPCGIMNLLVWIVYKVPASLCRKAWRRRRRRQLIRKGLLSPKGRKLSCGCEERETKAVATKEEMAVVATRKKDEVADRLEKEMWERFYNAGFGRSPSQREEIQKKV